MLAKVKKIHKYATFHKAHDTDIGFDLTCCGYERRGGVWRLKLGVIIEPRHDLYFMLVPRSSFCKTGWTQANCIGIIDPDYRGEWMMNISALKRTPKDDAETLFIDQLVGRRVAQAIPQSRLYGMVEFTEQLTETKRGEQGFGSTGK